MLQQSQPRGQAGDGAGVALEHAATMAALAAGSFDPQVLRAGILRLVADDPLPMPTTAILNWKTGRQIPGMKRSTWANQLCLESRKPARPDTKHL